MIEVLGRDNTVNVQKVMWCAAELDLTVERRDVGGQFGGNDTPAYLAMNPNGRIPTLCDGEFVLWESNAIVRYLCEAHGGAPWFPAEPAARALANQWMDWYLTTLHPPMTTIFWQLIRTAPEKRDQAAIDAAVAEAGKAWALLDDHLADNPFVTGPEITMGDIPVGCAAYRWHTMDFERPGLGNLRCWWEALAERPPYRDNVMLPLT